MHVAGGGEFLERGADPLIGGDPAGNHQRGQGLGAIERNLQPVEHAVERGLLKAGSDIGGPVLAAFPCPQHRTLEPGKAEMRR